MRHFCKLPVNMPNVALIVELMRDGDFSEDGVLQKPPHAVKMMALGVMQVTNAVGLGPYTIRRMPHDSKGMFFKQLDTDHYISVLHGQIMCLLGEECPAMNAGELWWLNANEDAVLINKSGDDALVLEVTTHVA